MSTGPAAHKHPYHLVDPSPWPIVGAAVAGVLFGGAVSCMHDGSYIAPGLGVLVRARHHVRVVARRGPEGDYGGYHTPVVQIGLRYGMVLFIACEVMFFVAFFWAFFSSRFIRSAASGRPRASTPSIRSKCRSSTR